MGRVTLDVFFSKKGKVERRGANKKWERDRELRVSTAVCGGIRGGLAKRET